MSNLILIFVSLVIGLLLQKVKTLPKETHVSLNVIILHVCLPALILISVPALTWESGLLSLVLVGWLIFATSYLFFSFLGKRLSWSASITGCLILTAGLGNTAFVGFPVVEAAYGARALKYAVLLDQTGTFLICSSFGIAVATMFSQGRVPKRELLKRVVVFPPFIAFAVALFLTSFGWAPSGMTKTILERLAGMLAPLALISVGLQLKVREVKQEWRLLTWGLGFKLLLAPVMIYTLYSFFDLPHEIFQIAVFEAAMGPMITASILAASYGLHPRLAGLMVGVGVPLSFLTLIFWYLILGRFS